MGYAEEIGLAAARSQLECDSGPVLFGWHEDRIRMTVLLRGRRAVQALMTATMLARAADCQGVAFATIGPVSGDPTIKPSDDVHARECAIGHGYDGQAAVWVIPLFRDDRGGITNDLPIQADRVISPALEIIELAWADPFGDVEVNSLWLLRNGCEVLLTT